MRPLERLDDPVVSARAGAAERGDVRRRRVRRRLVDDVDELRVGIALAVEADPLLDLFALLGLGQTVEPARLLAAPDEGVLLERDLVVLGVLVHGVERGPVHLVARPLDGAPLAVVLGRELVPVHAEVGTDLAAGVDVADELRERLRRTARARAGSARASRPRRPRPPAPPRAPLLPPAAPPRPAAPPVPAVAPPVPPRPALPPAPASPPAPPVPAVPVVPALPPPSPAPAAEPAAPAGPSPAAPLRNRQSRASAVARRAAACAGRSALAFAADGFSGQARTNEGRNQHCGGRVEQKIRTA